MSTRRVPAGAWIITLTVGALAVVLLLAVQAAQSVPKRITEAEPPKPSVKPSHSVPAAPRHPVPVDSGTGRRVVYSVGQQRVWLVATNESVLRTFTVWPGSIEPAKGSFPVNFRRPSGTGTDGVAIAHAVYFGTASAFSNAVDGASPSPAPDLRTGAIRERAADGLSMWQFATTGTVVSVVK